MIKASAHATRGALVAALTFGLTSLGCGEASKDDLGALDLALTSHAGGATYRLSEARLHLDGPESRDLSAHGEDTLSVRLAEGTYALHLLDGWQLVRVDADAERPVAARLVSENPSALVIAAGATTQATLRFELLQPGTSSGAEGELHIGVSIDADAGSGTSCTGRLRIAEVDYEQAGTDDAELIEIANDAECEASLAGVALELVNGGDGKVYAHYALDKAGATLAAGARLVLGDPAVMSALPKGTPSLPLTGTGLQNGPDGLRLVSADASVLDAFAYEGPVASAGEGSPVSADDGDGAWSRCPDDFDSDDNAADFALVSPSPGAPNHCE